MPHQALDKNGWLYDSTLIERWYTNSPTSPTVNELLWPYTMDAGIPQASTTAAGHMNWQ